MKNFLLAAIGFCWIGNMTIAGAMPTAPDLCIDDPNLKVIQLLSLSHKDFARLTGQKMGLGARISFGILKSKMRRAVKKDPAITVKSFMASQKKASAGAIVLFILLGAILLGFILFVALYTDFKK